MLADLGDNPGKRGDADLPESGGAGFLNAVLFIFSIVIMQDVRFDELKFLLFAILLIITPAFTLFVLFAPRGQ